eukprot:TRINITY_DN7936_c0_g1_i1.p1 TRINITY_DN7936_c0_g1~~TRINITY_DN7936_c0_g1_i1.p1  ORF type:complete len:236 (+),score=39.88 TRINITY_DN7936_c0_g1_i1:38-709(+)
MVTQKWITLLFFALFILEVKSYGVDVSSLISVDSFNCLKSKGFGDRVVVRISREGGEIDSNAVATLKNAATAGYPQIDGYIFPCYKCDPVVQVNNAINNLRSHGANFSMIWWDIEWGGQGTCDENVSWLEKAIAQGQALGLKMGVYANWNSWVALMCTWTGASHLPIWYPHYEVPENPSFSDFRPFGGWTKPFGKQFKGTTALCDAEVDENYFPCSFNCTTVW